MTKAQNCTPAADYRTDAPRADGWTYERQATFLMALAETGLVSAACKIAEMSPASAYSLRREARGAAFHLGWQAAHLLARDRLEDVLPQRDRALRPHREPPPHRANRRNLGPASGD